MNISLKRSLHDLHPKRVDIPFLIIISAILLGVGLCFPVLTVRKLWETNTFSVFSGITNLWHEKYYFLSALIFFFSAIFPVVKLLTLFLIWFIPMTDPQRKQKLQYLSFLGKWSMLDVFTVAVLIVAAKLGALASAKAEPGIYFFALSIFLSILVTSFQDRLVRSAKED